MSATWKWPFVPQKVPYHLKFSGRIYWKISGPLSAITGAFICVSFFTTVWKAGSPRPTVQQNMHKWKKNNNNNNRRMRESNLSKISFEWGWCVWNVWHVSFKWWPFFRFFLFAILHEIGNFFFWYSWFLFMCACLFCSLFHSDFYCNFIFVGIYSEIDAICFAWLNWFVLYNICELWECDCWFFNFNSGFIWFSLWWFFFIFEFIRLLRSLRSMR